VAVAALDHRGVVDGLDVGDVVHVAELQVDVGDGGVGADGGVTVGGEGEAGGGCCGGERDRRARIDHPRCRRLIEQRDVIGLAGGGGVGEHAAGQIER